MRSGSFYPAPSAVSQAAAREFDDVLDGLARGRASEDDCAPVDLTSVTHRPTWQLLVHAADSGRFALHGSASGAITEFEARQSNDIHDFGNRKGVYAAADGLWPMYFAIVDRDKVDSLINAAVVIVDRVDGSESRPLYYFSVSSTDPAPWRDGTVYLLPIDDFEREAEVIVPEGRVRSEQLFCPRAVRPVARVRVRPEDFPLLNKIRRHESDEVNRRAAADPLGFPWV